MIRIMVYSAKLLFLALLFLSASGQLTAHHSMAMFDSENQVTISGTISDIQWANPHVWIEVDVLQEDGSVQLWAAEFTSRIHLVRRGFPRDDINVGDDITITVNPYHDGRPGGRFAALETGKGVVYPQPRI